MYYWNVYVHRNIMDIPMNEICKQNHKKQLEMFKLRLHAPQKAEKTSDWFKAYGADGGLIVLRVFE